jgi:hypothetical protein
LILGFLKEVLQEIIESLNYFLIKLLNNSKVLNPCEFSINISKTKAKKIPPKFDKILGCYRLPPLKKSRLEIWRG